MAKVMFISSPPSERRFFDRKMILSTKARTIVIFVYNRAGRFNGALHSFLSCICNTADLLRNHFFDSIKGELAGQRLKVLRELRYSRKLI